MTPIDGAGYAAIFLRFSHDFSLKPVAGSADDWA
jgi:hypothetical protein